ncbi:peptidoglycan editing factor PgeF [Gorillibacterium sp. sgz5001074]|uniref:peptidoglycan editing factor PgeF n=1 Tax=Gorillibacterium sp. sgz5001074 TaxID=3446695 RepID=UPI003F66671E
MEPFIRKQRDGAPELYVLDAWMNAFQGLTAGFTGRNGGVSRAPYHTLNLGLHVDDDPAAVVENRRLLAEEVGIPLDRWTYGEQVHGCEVQVVDRTQSGRGTLSREDAFQAKDAFITADQGIVMAGLFADCVPLYFVDPVKRAAGLAHAGWKGTVLRVAEGTVRAMTDRFGTDPKDLYAAIGPSVGPCCYEVDDRIIDRVRTEAGKEGEPYFSPAAEAGKYRLNLKEINRQIMIEAGILPNRIEMTTLCTGCSLSSFFSHRAENGRTGRMAAWIGWKQEPTVT